MKLILVIISLFTHNILLSQVNTKVEDIGKKTTEFLIQRGNIEDFKYALKVKSLFPKEDFSSFKDSPAEFIVEMLQGSELELPVAWNELKVKANKLNIDANSSYHETYFDKKGSDNYVVTCVIKSASDYFTFSFNLLQWEKDIYISRFYKDVRRYKSIKEVKTNLYSIVDDEIEQEIQEMEKENYLQ